MPSPQERLAKQLARVPVAWLVLVIGVAASTAAWLFTVSRVEIAARSKFDATVADAQSAIRKRLQSYDDVLRGLQGLFLVTPRVTRDGFGRYIDNLSLEHREAIRSISYSQRVPAETMTAFVDQVRRDTSRDPRGFPDFVVKPPGGRPEYLVLVFIEPLKGNEAGFGLDLTAEPVRRASIERARDSGSVTASGRVSLLSVPVEGDWGVSLRLALYRRDLPIDTVEQRRRAFTGVISATFLVREFVSDIIWKDAVKPLHLRVFDVGERNAPVSANAPEALLYDSAPRREPAASFMKPVQIDAGGRLWRAEFAAPAHYFLATADRLSPWLVLAAGILISILLAGLVRALATSGQHAEAQRLAQELVEALPNPVYFKGTDGRYIGVNKAWEQFFGIPRAAFIGKTVHDLYPHDKDTADRLHANDRLLWERPGTQVYETTIATTDGTRHDAVYYKATYRRADGGVAGLIGTIIDITERKQAEQRQAMEHAVTRVLAGAPTLIDAIPTIIRTICDTLNWHCGSRWALDKEAGLLRCFECWGVDSPEIQEFVDENSKHTMTPELGSDQGLVRGAYNTGKPVWIADLTRATGFKRAALVTKADLHGAFCFPLLDGNEVLGVMEFFHRGVREPDDMLIHITQSIGRQIGQYLVRKQAEETLQFVATHDSLTKLPNRAMFQDRLENAAARAKRNRTRLAVLFIDLDRFKFINDTLGHDAGDALLREVARRLTAELRASDTVARLGGDEFVVLIEEIAEPVHAGTVAHKLVGTLGESFLLSGQDYRVTGSVGVSIYPDDTDDVRTLLKNADTAMYRAKEQGKNAFQFYSPQMNVNTTERLTLESSLHRALDRNELVLHYQPLVDIRSGRITGAEALVRWQHPELGLMPPAKFIPLAEETGLIIPIGEWVLGAACERNRAWERAGLPHLRIAVNLSPLQFMRGDLVKTVERVLARTGCKPTALELEITEGMVMRDPENAAALIQKLKEMGIHVAIDDFGTGYSSLAHLKRFPVDSLKVDRSFVMDIPGDANDMAITAAIISMAHNLGMKVIAEGVETREQLDFLRGQGCDGLQGFYFSKPLPEEQVITLLQQAREGGFPNK